MKTTGLVCLFVAILGLSVIQAMAQGPGCSSGKRDEGVYYTDCYPWISGDGFLPSPFGTTHNDRPRLQRAIDGSTGKLVFNEDNYYLAGGSLNLHSFAVLEGLSTVAHTTPSSGVRLIQTQDGTSVFFIGEDIHDVAVRDMGFYYWGVGTGNPTVPANSVAIKAEGDPTHLNSTFFEFEHIRVAHFTQGIYIHSLSPGGWQFDNNELQDASFDDCATGIHLDALNTGWTMNNVVFASLAGQNGLWIEKSGYININLMVGNGTYDGSHNGIANEFIKINEHGFININNANGEAYKKALIIDTPNGVKGTPVVLENSDFQECQWDDGGVSKPSVVFTNATVISTGNQYLCANKVARPSVEGMSEVSSTGDKFCLEGDSSCFSSASPFAETSRSGWAIKGWAALVRTDSVNSHNGAEFDMKKAFVDITSTYSSTDGPFKPFLSMTSSFYDGTSNIWLKYRYTFTRSNSNSRLEFNGDMNGTTQPNVSGYHFLNGPVQLQTVTASGITSYNSYAGGDAGSMLYCSDCTAGTNPCSTAGGGGGALALKVQSGNWACK